MSKVSKSVNPMVNFAQEREKDLAQMQNPNNVRPAFKALALDQCQKQCQSDRLPFDACFLNITSDLNVSASVRTLHLMGAQTIYIIGKRKLDRRALVGAEFYQDMQYLGGLNLETLSIDAKVVEDLIASKEHYFPIFVEMGGVNLTQVDWKSLLWNEKTKTLARPLLIFGNEHRGIESSILDLAKKYRNSAIVSLPMRGVLRSLNVSACVAAVTWDMVSCLFTQDLQLEDHVKV